MFAEIAEKKAGYKKFYEQSGMGTKLGAPEDSTNRTKMAVLTESQDNSVSLEPQDHRARQDRHTAHGGWPTAWWNRPLRLVLTTWITRRRTWRSRTPPAPRIALLR